MRLLSLAALLLFAIGAFAAELNIPALRSPVMDEAGLLTEPQRADLSALAYEIHANNGPQITVLTVPDLQDHSIEDFSIRVAEQWKLGLKERGNGLLITIATAERKMRIEVGEGIEGEVTDFDANQYIQRVLSPAFKAGEFHSGLRRVMEDIAQKFSVEFSDATVPVVRRAKPRTRSPLEAFLPIGFLVLFLGNFLLRRRRIARGFFSGFGLVGAGFLLIPGIALGVLFVLFFVGMVFGLAGFNNVLYAMASSRGGGRFGGGGGGFGGGGWSGGGGGFSGGGASGGW